MKKYLLRILVGLIAFAIGVSAVAITRNLSPRQEVCFVKRINFVHQSDEVNLQNPQIKSGKIKFIFNKFVREQNPPLAEFVLINDTENDIYYEGYIYIEDSYCTVDYKQKGKIKRSPACCGTGLETRTLKSGKAQTFTVHLMDWEYVNQVGFLIFDKNKKEKTIWSEKFELPKSVEDEIRKGKLKY